MPAPQDKYSVLCIHKNYLGECVMNFSFKGVWEKCEQIKCPHSEKAIKEEYFEMRRARRGAYVQR